MSTNLGVGVMKGDRADQTDQAVIPAPFFPAAETCETALRNDKVKEVF